MLRPLVRLPTADPEFHAEARSRGESHRRLACIRFREDFHGGPRQDASGLAIFSPSALSATPREPSLERLA